jgi:hypothetical protein
MVRGLHRGRPPAHLRVVTKHLLIDLYVELLDR